MNVAFCDKHMYANTIYIHVRKYEHMQTRKAHTHLRDPVADDAGPGGGVVFGDAVLGEARPDLCHGHVLHDAWMHDDVGRGRWWTTTHAPHMHTHPFRLSNTHTHTLMHIYMYIPCMHINLPHLLTRGGGGGLRKGSLE